jgi:hypothetical protein
MDFAKQTITNPGKMFLNQGGKSETSSTPNFFGSTKEYEGSTALLKSRFSPLVLNRLVELYLFFYFSYLSI